LVCLTALVAGSLAATLPVNGTVQDTLSVQVVRDSVMIRFIETDFRSVIQALGRYLPKPVLVGAVEQRTITIETPVPIANSRVTQFIRSLVESQGFVFLEDSMMYRVEQPQSTQETRDSVEEPVVLNVVRLRHARAGDVAATVNQLFGGAGAFAGSQRLSGGALSQELRDDAASTTQEPGGLTTTQQEQHAVLSGPVTMVPDELTNAILVRATASDFALVQTAIQELDLRPLQALIQVLIVEVRRDRAFSVGLSAAFEGVKLGDGTTLGGTLIGAGLGDFVLTVMGLESFDLDAALSGAFARGDARIVSRPVVLASNNREARILVGSQRPFIQVSRSLPTDAPVRDQVVQYRDVGTALTVLPTINGDGYVSLFIRQEVNSATNETQFEAPVISTREAETDVLVRDGQTVVIGGMRERQHEVVKTGIPLLSALPIVGGIFGSQNRSTTETELFIFITPRILSTDEASQRAAEEALQQLKQSGVNLDTLGVRKQ
jgi:general secretion pathway protein D